MTRIKIKNLIWDDFNIVHSGVHGVAKVEIESGIKRVKYHKHTYGKRYLVVCESETRTITIVVSRKSPNTYYVISARPVNKKERENI